MCRLFLEMHIVRMSYNSVLRFVFRNAHRTVVVLSLGTRSLFPVAPPGRPAARTGRDLQAVCDSATVQRRLRQCDVARHFCCSHVVRTACCEWPACAPHVVASGPRAARMWTARKLASREVSCALLVPSSMYLLCGMSRVRGTDV